MTQFVELLLIFAANKSINIGERRKKDAPVFAAFVIKAWEVKTSMSTLLTKKQGCGNLE